MRELITNMTTAMGSDEQFLAWCRDNLCSLPTIAFEPEIPTEGVPDNMYPFVFLHSVKITGASAISLEMSVGVMHDAGPTLDTVTARVQGAETVVSRETSAGLLLALSMYLQAVDVIHRMKLGTVDQNGETGSVILHPYYEAWGTIGAKWSTSTRKPLGR